MKQRRAPWQDVQGRSPRASRSRIEQENLAAALEGAVVTGVTFTSTGTELDALSLSKDGKEMALFLWADIYGLVNPDLQKEETDGTEDTDIRG